MSQKLALCVGKVESKPAGIDVAVMVDPRTLEANRQREVAQRGGATMRAMQSRTIAVTAIVPNAPCLPRHTR